MQRFEDTNKVHAPFAKGHIAKLARMGFGYWQCVFQMDSGDTVDAQRQFGSDVITPCAEVAHIRVDGEPRR